VNGTAALAAFQSPSQITCALPALSVGFYNVTISNDGVNIFVTPQLIGALGMTSALLYVMSLSVCLPCCCIIR